MNTFKVIRFQSEEEQKSKVLEFLKSNRSRNEISVRTNTPIEIIEKWASEWRKGGELPTLKRSPMDEIHAARILAKGYYGRIRKRYNSMIWNDKINNRSFGFDSPVKAIHYYLKDGKPRVCTYCGRSPKEGMVWGLDRIDSNLGHIPGNLVPCCGSHPEGSQLSCQASKSKYSLWEWMTMNISRSIGRQADKRYVDNRIEEIENFAKELKSM
jgi:hypothetical protein